MILDLVSLVNGEGGVEELLILILNVPIIMVIIKIILMIIIKIIIMIILITWSALPMVRVVSRNSTPSFFSPSSSRKIWKLTFLHALVTNICDDQFQLAGYFKDNDNSNDEDEDLGSFNGDDGGDDDEVDEVDEDLGSLQRPPASPQIKRVAS